MMRISTGLALAASLVAFAPAAVAQSRVEVGILECRGSTKSFIVGSVTELGCVFRPTGGGAPHNYSAHIERIGIDIGTSQNVAVAWGVLAPTRNVGRGDLRGRYGGVSANAAVGVGLGANALVGGSNNTFALQPVSVQAQTGLNIAAGISGMELRSR